MPFQTFLPKIMATAVSIVSLTAISAPSAHADVTKFCSQPFDRSGYACFHSTGDKLEVLDNYADGLRSVVEWKVEDRDHGNEIVRTGECHNAKGEGKTVWCNYDLPEGKNMLFVFAVVARNGAHGKNEYTGAPVIAYVSGR